ncbi:DNA polymerase III subunit beta family protein [Amycolatopsis pigmentata]|uniref:MerR family transcriptional regulator n=1 Tax=Amycolatopsis pigmentata TaxID=450801 RepID=A0ABW5G3C5_9PSEU
MKLEDGRVPDPELLTIGAFARAARLTASALRFYADSGLLRPARVDGTSGYRYYARDQVGRAVTIRRLREIDMPLERIAEVLDSGPAEAVRLIDDHVADLAHRAHQARETAAAVKAALGSSPRSRSVRVNGSVFTAAAEQVLTATIHEPDLPVLNGVHIEVSAGEVVLTATDRYRLATRTLVRSPGDDVTWSATADADELRLAMPWTRRRHDLLMSVRTGSISFRGDGTTRECRTLAEPFPDYRLMLASLPETRTRVLISRNALLRALEEQHDQRVRLHIRDSALTVSSKGRPVTAVVTGPALGIEFAVSTLHPAISSAVGPDVMLELAGNDQPVVVRSADDGDFTTLAMPVSPEGPAR